VTSDFVHGDPGGNDLEIGDGTMVYRLAFDLKPPLARALAFICNQTFLFVAPSK
jgi:hypothetical protein